MAEAGDALLSFSRLALEDEAEDEECVLRGGADAAFLAWSAAEESPDDVGPTRCVLSSGDPFWDALSTNARLEVVLKPHRTEEASEHLVNSVRPFSVLVTLVDPESDRALGNWTTTLRASLVFADTGEAVPAQKGEPPLNGELEKRLDSTGEACVLRLRAAALSFNHGRRTFAVRIEADELPGGRFGVAATSAPMRAVARLPNAVAPSRPAAVPTIPQPPPPVMTPTPAEASASAPAPTPVAVAVGRQPATPIVVELDDDDVYDGASAPANPAANKRQARTDDELRGPPPTVATAEQPCTQQARTQPCIAAQESMNELLDLDEMAALAASGTVGLGPPLVAPSLSFTSDSSVVSSSCAVGALSRPPPPPPLDPAVQVVHELRAQGELLQHALAQQRRIMGEMEKLRASAPPMHLV